MVHELLFVEQESLEPTTEGAAVLHATLVHLIQLLHLCARNGRNQAHFTFIININHLKKTALAAVRLIVSTMYNTSPMHEMCENVFPTIVNEKKVLTLFHRSGGNKLALTDAFLGSVQSC